MKYQILHQPWRAVSDPAADAFLVQSHTPSVSTWQLEGAFHSEADARRFIELHATGEKVVAQFDGEKWAT